MNRTLITLFVVIAAALVLARLTLYAPEQDQAAPSPPAALQHLLLPQPRQLEAFALRTHNNTPFDLAQLTGQWTFVFFGYTHCPDICPTTLSTLKGVAKRLQAEPAISESTRFVFISVDPKRDTLAHLKQYIGYFHPDFIAATGERTAIDNLARQLGAVYMFEGDTNKDDYIVNHSASVALIDPQGRWIARFNPPHSVSQFSSDYLLLRNTLYPASPQD